MTYRNKRSVPNRGEQCGLYVLGNSSPVGRPLVTRFNETVMCAGQGEDYSNSAWPIVVKVKRGGREYHDYAHLTRRAEEALRTWQGKKLVRRSHLRTIIMAWLITVPATRRVVAVDARSRGQHELFDPELPTQLQ